MPLYQVKGGQKFRGIRYKPLNYLKTFHDDRYTHTNRAIITGYGGGKTYAVCMENILVSALNPGVPNIIIEPTFQMVKDILEPTIINILDDNGFRYTYNKSEKNFYLPEVDGYIWLRSGDKPEKLKGMNAGLVTIDEPFIQDVDTYKVAISRSRHPKAKVRGIILSGTPETLNWGKDLIERPEEHFKVYSGTTYDNHHLEPDYVEKLRASYGEKEVQAYVFGKFVNFTEGLVYYSFTPENIIPNFTPVHSLPLEVSCDFNIGLMNWTIGQEIGGVDYSFDCVEMTGSAKTEVMCHLLRNKLREIGHTGDPTFYCDIAGSANRPEASRSNIAIIQEAFPAARIETRHIANIADRIAATNARFCDSNGTRKAYVTENLKRLINDYQRVSWDHFFKKGTAGDLTHVSDGESYKFFAKYPLIGRTTVTRRHY